MTIFALMAGSVLGLLLQTADGTGNNIRRTSAANLASRQVESLRRLSVAEIKALPKTVISAPVTINGVTYTVKQVTEPADKASTTNICTPPASGTSERVAFRRASVTVTWPDMGRTPPVKAQTLLALGVGSDYAATGAPAAITVAGADGKRSGLPVDLVSTSPSDIEQEETDSSGCATFIGLNLSPNYQASLNVPGNVGTNNAQLAPPGGLAVDTSSGNLFRNATAIEYAKARSLNVAMTAPSGAPIASPIALVVGRNSPTMVEFTPPTCLGVVISACMTGFPGTVKSLYPATYSVRAGGCSSSDPTLTSAVSKDITGDPATTLTADIPLGAITVTVKNLLGSPISGRVVSFTHPSSATGCTSADSYTATTSSTGAVLGVPYGNWTVTVANATASPTPSPTSTFPATPAPTASPSSTAVLSADVVVSSTTPSVSVALRVLL